MTLNFDDRTLILDIDETKPDAPHWWADGDVGGKCWLDHDTLLIGPIKSYGAACHYPPSHPEVVAERAAHLTKAGTLPPWKGATAKVPQRVAEKP